MKQAETVDLSWNLNENSPVWPGATRFQRKQLVGYEEGYAKYQFTLDEGIGTHMDSPAHFIEGKKTIEDLNVERFIAPAVVVDVTDKVKKNPDYELTVSDLKEWESRYGSIPRGAFVIMYSGWQKRWPDEEAYRNTDEDGVMHFPGFAPEAAKFLTNERQIQGIGIDTLSLDYGPSKKFQTHFTMFKHDKYQIENLTNLDELPASGAVLVALPAKFDEAPEAPVRVIALIP